MSTNSTIAIKNENGSFTSVYCHWDGYPEYVGRILALHFNTPEKIRELLALGTISQLAPDISCPDGHSFENPVKGHAVFYGRDRGEPNIQAKTYGTYIDLLKRDGREYNYFYMDGQWEVEHKGKVWPLSFHNYDGGWHDEPRLTPIP
jgi:hypothetical protein